MLRSYRCGLVVFAVLSLVFTSSARGDERAAALKARLEAAKASLVSVELTSRATLERFPGVGEGGKRIVRTEATGVVVGADGLVVLAAARVDPASAAFSLLGSKAKAEVEKVLVIGQDGKSREASWLGRDEERGLAFVRIAASARAGLSPLSFPEGNLPGIGDELAVVSLSGKTLGRAPRVETTRVSLVAEKPRKLLGTSPQVAQAQGGVVFSLEGGATPIGLLVGLPQLEDKTGEAHGEKDLLSPDVLATASAGYVLPAADVRAAIAKPPEPGKATGIAKRPRSWIGIKPETVTAEVAKLHNLPLDDGVRVVKVFKGTPAEKAGLVANDVLTRLDGELISLDPGESFRTTEDLGVGQKVKLTVFHEGKGKEVDLVLAEAPLAPEDAPRTKLAPLGGVVRDLTFFDKDELGLAEASAGAVLVELDPDGAFARAGLRAGDSILQVDGKDVAGTDGLREALGDSGEKALSVKRGSEALSLKLRR